MQLARFASSVCHTSFQMSLFFSWFLILSQFNLSLWILPTYYKTVFFFVVCSLRCPIWSNFRGQGCSDFPETHHPWCYITQPHQISDKPLGVPKKAFLKGWVFKFRLKALKSEVHLRSNGRLFQSFGAAPTKARSPRVGRVLKFRFESRYLLLDLRL